MSPPPQKKQQKHIAVIFEVTRLESKMFSLERLEKKIWESEKMLGPKKSDKKNWVGRNFGLVNFFCFQ